MKFDQAHKLATDATFIERVQFASVTIAVEKLRGGLDGQAKDFARSVLLSSESTARQMAWGILTHPKIGDGGKDDAFVDDDALVAVIGDLWDLYAGV